MTGVTYPNTVAMSASYDPATGRLAELAHTLGAADLARFLYGYNAVGSITQIAEPAASDRSFGYDALQRLVSGGTAAAPESYSYDAEGNRLVSHLSAAHLTDAGNRLLQDDAFDYAWDENGNLASKTDRATLEVTSYSYDAQDQLIRIDFPNGTFATYAYDALGRRIARDVDDGAGGREVTAYLYDGPDILIETDGTGALLARYAHGDRVDQPLAMTRAGQDYYLHADHQGSIVRVTDAAGAVVNSYEYDAYGRRLAATEGVALPYGYTGREFDAESGLMYYRARMYDPQTGRFLQTDPIGIGAGDFNLYRYVANNPVNFTDPTGLDCNAVGDTVYCIPRNPNVPPVQFPRPEGWPDELSPGSHPFTFHSYNYEFDVGGTAACVLQGLVNNPTPGQDEPASPDGTVNNALPLPIDFTVTSYTQGNSVINVTTSSHILSPGYVVRLTVTNSSGGQSIINYGEGADFAQSIPLRPFGIPPEYLAWRTNGQFIGNNCECEAE